MLPFKWTNREVKEDIKRNLDTILIYSKFFSSRNGQDWYCRDLDEFEGMFIPPKYRYWDDDKKVEKYFDIPVKISKTKLLTRIQILNIATVEAIEFDEKVLFTIIFK